MGTGICSLTASPITTVACVSAACTIDDTIANRYTSSINGKINLEHPSGIVETFCKSVDNKIEYVTVSRTARRIAEGKIYIY